jgi:1-deoxy-D-xylulose-5-phosphate synthase
MAQLRQQDGISGFPRRCESIYDAFGAGHSSTSISAALGMALASHLKKEMRYTLAVIGDGAMTAGMAFEAMNHAGVCDDLPFIIVLNDNEMSISPPVGALNRYLARLLSGSLYAKTRQGLERMLRIAPPVLRFVQRMEEHAKGMFVPATLFEEFGLNYIGPIDGHDLDSLIPTLQNLKKLKGPQFLHIITKKGQGYKLAEADPILYHGPGRFNPAVGIEPTPPSTKNGCTYTQVFGAWLCDAAQRDDRVVGITPAMREGSGLVEFERRFPHRYYDVGIAEQHAITLAGGMATEGLCPVVAIYSTFLQRGYDQLIHDVALQNLHVIFALDRGGLVGADGATHNGAYDLAFLRCIPNMVIMAASDEQECWQMLETALHHTGPVAVRYPRGKGPGRLPACMLEETSAWPEKRSATGSTAVQPPLSPLALGSAELRRISIQPQSHDKDSVSHTRLPASLFLLLVPY